MFCSRKYTVLDFVQNIPATPSSEGILFLVGQRQRLQMHQKKLKEAQEKEKNDKIECMKQGPAENMTIAVLKQLLIDKGITLSTKATKWELDLTQIINHKRKKWYKKARKVSFVGSIKVDE